MWSLSGPPCRNMVKIGWSRRGAGCEINWRKLISDVVFYEEHIMCEKVLRECNRVKAGHVCCCHQLLFPTGTSHSVAFRTPIHASWSRISHGLTPLHTWAAACWNYRNWKTIVCIRIETTPRIWPVVHRHKCPFQENFMKIHPWCFE